MKMNRLTAVAAVVLSVCFSAFAVPLKQALVTVSGYSGTTTLEDFPVLVRISQSAINGFSYSDCAADGGDISFALENGTALAHEIDTWNSEGESLVWVKVPQLSGADTSFYFRWNDSAPPENTPSAVWSAGYAGVWHMNGASGVTPDSTGHELHATPKIAPNDSTATDLDTYSIGVEGIIGTARQTGTNEKGGYLSVPSYDDYELGGTFAVSGWFYLNGIAGQHRLIGRKQRFNESNGWEIEMPGTAYTLVKVRAASDRNFTRTIPSLKQNWVHLTFVYNDSICTVYTNGVQCGESGSVTAATDNGLPLSFGCGSAGTSGKLWVRGYLDEFRLKDGVPSADWLAAEYATMTSTGFTTFGAAETLTFDDVFSISGSPEFIGTPTPGYGAVKNLAVGSELTLSMPVTEVPGEGTVTNYLAGWKLEKLDGATGTLTPIRSSSDEGEVADSCTYTHTASAQFTWLWNARDMLGIDGLSVVTNGGDHLKFTMDVTGIGYTAPSATLKLCYGIVPGEFVWTQVVSAAVSGIDTLEATLSNLTPGVYYYVKAVLETNDEAKDTVETEVVGIRADSSVESDAVSPVTELLLDGSGCDSLVVSGTLSPSLDSSCTLTVLVGDSPETMMNVWTGSTVASGGTFSFTLGGAEPGTAKYLAPRSTYYVSVIAMTAGGAVLISPAKTVTMSPKTYWVYTEEDVDHNGTGYGYVTDGVWRLSATRERNTTNLTVSGGNGAFYGQVPCPMDFTEIRNPEATETYQVRTIGVITRRNAGQCLYDYAAMLTELIAPHCVAFTTDYNFNACTALTNVVLNSDFSATTEGGFNACSSLAAFSPRTFKCEQLKSKFFQNCGSLAGAFHFPVCTVLNGEVFSNTKIEEVTAPALTVIGGNAFKNCGNLSSVTVSPKFYQVGNCAFSGCTSLEPDLLETLLPTTIRYIGSSSLAAGYMGEEFSGCTSLTGPLVWNFPNMATNVVNKKCFYNCTSLEKVEFKTPVLEIRDSAFQNIKPGAEVYMHEDVTDLFEPAAVASTTYPYPRIYLKDNVDGWLEAFGKYHHVIRKEDFANEEFSVTPEVPACGNHPTRTWQNMVAKMALDTEVCDSEKDGNTVTKVTMRKKGVIGFMMFHDTTHQEYCCWIFQVPKTGFSVIVR